MTKVVYASSYVFIKLSTGEELISEVLTDSALNLDKPLKKNAVIWLKNPMKMMLVPMEKGDLGLMPIRWVYPSIVENNLVRLFANGILAWTRPSKSAIELYTSALEAYTKMDDERQDGNKLKDEQTRLLKAQAESAASAASSGPSLPTSKPKANVSLEDFEETFKKATKN